MQTQETTFNVARMYRMNDTKFLKAFADIVVNDAILIKGIKVIDGANGTYVAMPSEQGRDQKWYESVRCLNPETKEHISKVVLEKYREE